MLAIWSGEGGGGKLKLCMEPAEEDDICVGDGSSFIKPSFFLSMNFIHNPLFQKGKKEYHKGFIVAADKERCFFTGGRQVLDFAMSVLAKPGLWDIDVFVFINHFLLDVPPPARFPFRPPVAFRLQLGTFVSEY